MKKRVERNVHRSHHEGPRFTKSFGSLGDESTNVNYYNSSGLVLRCSASGKPSPTIEWYYGSDSEYPRGGSPASDINGLRYTREDGSLILLPFSSDQYRQDVHTTAYWCKAANTIGSIISPLIQLKGGECNYFTKYYQLLFYMSSHMNIMRDWVVIYMFQWIDNSDLKESFYGYYNGARKNFN